MANIKVSELNTATSFNDDDYTMIVQSGDSKKITKNNMFDGIIIDTGWLNLPLETGIVQYTNDNKYNCKYRKINNQVFITGCIKGVSANNTTIAILPSGYKPTTMGRYVTGRNVNACSILSYETDGKINFVSYTTNTTPSATDYIYIQTSFFVD